MERQIDSGEEKRSDRWRDNVCGLKTGSRRVTRWSYCFPRERRRDWRSARDREEDRDTPLLEPHDVSEATSGRLFSCSNLHIVDFMLTRRCISRVPISVYLTCAMSDLNVLRGRKTSRRRTSKAPRYDLDIGRMEEKGKLDYVVNQQWNLDRQWR